MFICFMIIVGSVCFGWVILLIVIWVKQCVEVYGGFEVDFVDFVELNFFFMDEFVYFMVWQYSKLYIFVWSE